MTKPDRALSALLTLVAAIALAHQPPAAAAVQPAVRGAFGADPSACSTANRMLMSEIDPPYEGEEIGGRVRVHTLLEEASGLGIRVLVLLPPGYGRSARRYPVVYLLPPGNFSPDVYLTGTDLIEFTANQPEDRQAIVVLADSTAAGYFVDWRSGAFRSETFFVRKLLPFIDRGYRTIPDGRHRAIGGYSGGGGSATMLAGRHPDRFAAVAGFSGLVDYTDPVAMSLIVGVGAFGGCVDAVGWFGDPITGEVWWHDHSQPSLAPNFRGMGVFVSARSGMPCDENDAGTLWSSPLELAVWRTAQTFHAALDRAGVAHAYDIDRCGTHGPPYLEHQVKDWWGWDPASPGPLFEALGTPAPDEFDHRRASGAFGAYGWTFEADPERAPEFLDLKEVSREGLTLTGSGTVEVTTARYFGANQKVRVSITGPDGTLISARTVRAGGKRLRLSVDLGPVHRHQQFTPQQRALEALGGYWQTRTVRFERDEP